MTYELIAANTRLLQAGVANCQAQMHHRMCRIGLADADGFECSLTQEQLGDVLGLTSVHVKRTLQALRREGLVLSSRRRFTLPNPTRLHVAAGFDGGLA